MTRYYCPACYTMRDSYDDDAGETRCSECDGPVATSDQNIEGSCLHCGDEVPDDREWYCSDECGRENESVPEDMDASWYQKQRAYEVTGIPPEDQ